MSCSDEFATRVARACACMVNFEKKVFVVARMTLVGKKSHVACQQRDSGNNK